jgi:hypothetical protein
MFDRPCVIELSRPICYTDIIEVIFEELQRFCGKGKHEHSGRVPEKPDF